jgi:hypothetical protein
VVFLDTGGPAISGTDGVNYSINVARQGTAEQSILAARPGYQVQLCDLEAGQYHPRMYRGDYHFSPVLIPPTEQAEFALASEQEDILLLDLRDICRVVAPDTKTDGAYGSRIRNLLIMACTEIEAQWRGILAANGYPNVSGRLTTADYVKLCGPMRLEQYDLKCMSFREYRLVTPFKGWSASAPSQTLPWYEAYNDTKHDRVGAFSRATLASAVDAAAALCIMLVAQYGTAYMNTETLKFFGLVSRPNWLPHERVYKSPAGSTWTAVKYPF